MLVSFSVTNWASFRDKTTFSMIASEDEEHLDRIPKLKGYNIDVLPVAAIYGGNASGKSNFCDAFSFMQNLVVKGIDLGNPIYVNPFRLDSKTSEAPSRFEIILFVEHEIYEFSLVVDSEEILEEKLTVNFDGENENVVYSRIDREIEFGEIAVDKNFLSFIFKSTRKNQLFLYKAIDSGCEYFEPVYDWFKEKLHVISPNISSDFSFGSKCFVPNSPEHLMFNELFSKLDVGISKIIDHSRNLTEEEIEAYYTAFFADGDSKVQIRDNFGSSLVRLNGKSDGSDEILLRTPYHKAVNGSEVEFNMFDESDGSKRLINFIPGFINLLKTEADSVFIIDELDRSLHTLLTRKLLEIFLDRCSAESRSQLIFTTHDVLLMDKDLFRLDEMWTVERGNFGQSAISALSDYEQAFDDKDIRKSYLEGRVGGIPHFLLGENFTKMYGNIIDKDKE